MYQRPIFLLSLCLGLGSAALAADPPAQASAPAATSTEQPGQATAAAPAPGVTATSAVPTANSVKADSGTAGDVTPEQIKEFRAAGYRPEVHNGRTLFCRREPQIGTRFETKTCGDAAQIERSTRDSQELAERLQSKAYTKANGNP